MKNTKPINIQRKWHLIDANNQILGRLASNVAQILMGKNKPYYVPYLDCGDFIVVTNATKIMLSGKKEKQKPYYHYSGYPGGLKTKTAADVRSQKPEQLIRHAVVGMLPKTKMGKLMIKKLYIYPESNHPHKERITTAESALDDHPRGGVEAKPREHPGGEQRAGKSVYSVVARN